MNRSGAFWVFYVPTLVSAVGGAWILMALEPRETLDWTLAAASIAALALACSLAPRAVVRRRLQTAAEEARSGQIGLSAAVPGLLPLLEMLRETRGEAHSTRDAYQQTGAQLGAVLEGMQDAVLALDARERIVFANRQAERLLQLPEGRAAGKQLLQVIRDHRIAELVGRCRDDRQPQRAELTLGGSPPRQVELSATPQEGVQLAEPCVGVVVVIRDQTDVKRLESLRRDFVTNVSHELKTPLSSIRAYAETLADGAIDDPSVRMRFLGKISEQAERLNELILDLISLGRIETGREVFEPAELPLRPIVESSVDRRREAAGDGDTHLSFEVPPDAAVFADEEAVRQILDNLLDNALKYSPGASVTVACRRVGRQWEIQVADTGVGIAAEHLPRLFERFYRADRARARELGGTGLGLSIVKHLAHAFGGEVGVESELGKGSTFWVRLPAPEAAVRPSPAPAASHGE